MRSLEEIIAANSDQGIARNRRLALALNGVQEVKSKRAAKAAKRKDKHVD